MNIIRHIPINATKILSVLLIFSLLISQYLSIFASTVSAATSPWSQTDWSSGDYSSISGVDTTTTAGQVTLEKQEKFTNTGFETDTSSWTAATKTFSDSSFAGATGAVAAWPLDDTTSTQSYARVVNPADSEGREIIINGGFDTWSSDNPSSWTVSESGSNVVTENPSGKAQLVRVDAETAVYQTILTIGKTYQVSFDLDTVTSGSLQLKDTNTSIGIYTTTGTKTATFVATGTAIILRASANGANITIDNVSVKQINIPTTPVVAASELLSDGNMEASGTSSWTAGNNATLSKQDGTRTGGSGSKILRITGNGSTTFPYAYQTGGFTSGTIYRIQGYARSDGSNIPRIVQPTSASTVWTGTTSTSWQPFDFLYKDDSTNSFQFVGNLASGYVEFDDVSVTLDTSIRQGELLLEGGMEESGTSYWGVFNNATLSKQTDSPHGGSQVLRIVTNTGSTVGATQAVMATGKTFKIAGYARSDGTAQPRVTTDAGGVFLGTTSNSWQYFEITVVASVANNALYIEATGGSGGNYAEFDDVSVTEVSPLIGKNTNGVTVGSTANGHLTNAYTFDGSNDVVNIYSSDLNSVFNPSGGTLLAWAKVSASSNWTDGSTDTIIQIAGSSDSINMRKNADNTLQLYRVAGGTTKAVSHTPFSSTDFFMVAISWDQSADEVKAFVNGSQVGSTLTGIGTWTQNLGSTGVVIGAANTSGLNPWSGMINDVRLYNRALSPAEIANLYSGGTATRDTGTKYAGTASSKLVSYEGYNSTFVQSVNVGTTETYQLEAYAYTTGAAVTTNDVDLYYNGAAITTAYAATGTPGWYKLTGTVTGANEARDYGVLVKAGKTVYVDNLSLWNYPTSATLTSSIFDSGGSSNWGTLTFSATTPSNTSLSVKVRSGNQTDLSDATAFSSCSAITTGSTVGGTTCAANGTRYAQYQVSFASTDYITSPTFSSFSLGFAPSSVVNLIGPGNNDYTNNLRPTFAWSKNVSSDAVVKYILQIDRVDASSTIVDNIPPDRSSDLETSKYLIHYDSSGIYFSTKSSSDWAESENDGKLTEGRVNWKVTAQDAAGNQTTATRTLFVDTTSPSVSIESVNGITSQSSSFATTDSTPTIKGTVSDPTVSEVSSGAESIDIKIEKRTGTSYSTVVLYTLNNTNSQFEYTPSTLTQGIYKITFIARDHAGNSSSPTQITLQIGSLSEVTQVTEPSEGQSSAATPPPGPAPSLSAPATPSPTEKPQEEITVPTQIQGPSVFERVSEKIGQVTSGIIGATGNLISFIFQGIGRGVSFTINLAVTTAKGVGSGIAFVGRGVGNFIALVARNVGNGIAFVGNGIGNIYNSIAQSAPGIIKSGMLAISSAFTGTTHAIGKFANTIASGLGAIVGNIASGIGSGFNFLANGAKNIVANVSFAIGTRADSVSNSISAKIVQFGYMFATEPTRITHVAAEVISPTSVKITWETNHPASGKVNWGLEDGVYTFDMQSDKKTNFHEFILTDLQPDTQYHYEVMSQNKNYVYDANRKFTTPKE